MAEFATDGVDRAPRPMAPRLDEAEEFLSRIRSILHLESERNHNVLTHELQERSAEILRYAGGEPRQRDERFMSDYFRHARSVSRALDWTRQTAPTPAGVNLVRSRDGIRFVDVELARAHPSSWLSVFQTAVEAGSSVAYNTLAWMQQHADRYVAEDFFPTPADRSATSPGLRRTRFATWPRTRSACSTVSASPTPISSGSPWAGRSLRWWHSTTPTAWRH